MGAQHSGGGPAPLFADVPEFAERVAVTRRECLTALAPLREIDETFGGTGQLTSEPSWRMIAPRPL